MGLQRSVELNIHLWSGCVRTSSASRMASANSTVAGAATSSGLGDCARIEGVSNSADAQEVAAW